MLSREATEHMRHTNPRGLLRVPSLHGTSGSHAVKQPAGNGDFALDGIRQ